MLIQAKTIKGYKLNSLDGEIGTVNEFYFDDHYWAIRYLVANTGNWLTGRQVLISPYALLAVNGEEHHISIDLTRKQIEESPLLNSDKPVSRQFEETFYGYYGWPVYYDGLYMWGANPDIVRDRARDQEKIEALTRAEKEAWDPHLRSTHDVSGHHIQAPDGEIGHVHDFIIDDETWAIRYLVIDTLNWWPGKKILLSPLWIDRISWDESKVFVNLHRESIKQAPEYLEESLLTRDYETRLHGHYNRREYWLEEAVAAVHSH